MQLLPEAQAQHMCEMKWMTLAGAAALALSMLVSGCTEPRGELAGCTTDTQCKGVRVCSPQGECVSPLALPDPNPDAGSGNDTWSPDASDDSGSPNNDTGNDTSGPGTCDSAPTARLSTSSRAVGPGALVELDASQSTAAQGAVADYGWSIVDYPYASSHPHLKPELEVHAGGKASFVANTLGRYTVELFVFDAAGNRSCNTARVDITAATDADIFVELVWDTPDDNNQMDDDGTDLDLHYKHPEGDWGFEPLDIFWYNPTADWGDEGESRDDPELIRDDEDGAGPESIAHDRPDDLNYNVGVYYYDDYGFGESKATVRVYFDGDLAHEVSAEPMSGTDTFYEAVTIDADEETVAADDIHYEGYPPLD